MYTKKQRILRKSIITVLMAGIFTSVVLAAVTFTDETSRINALLTKFQENAATMSATAKTAYYELIKADIDSLINVLTGTKSRLDGEIATLTNTSGSDASSTSTVPVITSITAGTNSITVGFTHAGNTSEMRSYSVICSIPSKIDDQNMAGALGATFSVQANVAQINHTATVLGVPNGVYKCKAMKIINGATTIQYSIPSSEVIVGSNVTTDTQIDGVITALPLQALDYKPLLRREDGINYRTLYTPTSDSVSIENREVTINSIIGSTSQLKWRVFVPPGTKTLQMTMYTYASPPESKVLMKFASPPTGTVDSVTANNAAAINISTVLQQLITGSELPFYTPAKAGSIKLSDRSSALTQTIITNNGGWIYINALQTPGAKVQELNMNVTVDEACYKSWYANARWDASGNPLEGVTHTCSGTSTSTSTNTSTNTSTSTNTNTNTNTITTGNNPTVNLSFGNLKSLGSANYIAWNTTGLNKDMGDSCKIYGDLWNNSDITPITYNRTTFDKYPTFAQKPAGKYSTYIECTQKNSNKKVRSNTIVIDTTTPVIPPNYNYCADEFEINPYNTSRTSGFYTIGSDAIPKQTKTGCAFSPCSGYEGVAITTKAICNNCQLGEYGCDASGKPISNNQSTSTTTVVTIPTTTPMVVNDYFGQSSCWTLAQLQLNNSNNGNNTAIIGLVNQANAAGGKNFWYCVDNKGINGHLYIPSEQRTCLPTGDTNCYRGIIESQPDVLDLDDLY